MKKLLTFVLLFSLLGCFNPVLSHSLHEISSSNELGYNNCSANAIGAHTLITAAHCEMENAKFSIDGEKAEIVKKLLDNQDHMILVTNKNFESFVKFYPKAPIVGEKIFFYGNPSSIQLEDIYREGYVGGEKLTGSEHCDVFMLVVRGGDSGALIFNSHNQVVGEVSISPSIGFTGSFPFKFTSEQLKEIR